MARRYLVVSDLHLSDVEDHADGWKAYKSSRFTYDEDFARLLAEFVADRAEGDERVLVLNGDVIDFDLVTAVPAEPAWAVRRTERKRGLDATEDKAVWKLERVLAQHPGFVGALARFLADGHRLVYLLGNHDRELHFAAVRRALLDALHAAAGGRGFAESQLVIEPWFYFVPGEIYVEHGQQYDHYTSFRQVLEPTVQQAGQEAIALPMGNLSNRILMTRMGYFNPHASDYILNMFAYAWHWLKFYAFSRRSLVIPWLWGSLVVISRLLRQRRRQLGAHKRVADLFPAVATRYGIGQDTVRALWDLQDPPITGRLFRIVREFWIDRAIMAVIMTGGTVALALVPIPLWIKLMVPLTGFPLLYFIYEWAVQGESIFTIETKFPEVARKVAALVPVQVVTFGHTHQPRLIPLCSQTVFVDTGTWAPVTRPGAFFELVPGLRNYLVAEFDQGRACVQLRSWLPLAPGSHDRDPRSTPGV
jgi:UDP-2,3-diacylglucosamine pyrophosphatase LpxH